MILHLPEARPLTQTAQAAPPGPRSTTGHNSGIIRVRRGRTRAKAQRARKAAKGAKGKKGDKGKGYKGGNPKADPTAWPGELTRKEKAVLDAGRWSAWMNQSSGK